MTDRKLTCAACKSAITKGDIAGSDLEFGGELKATNQPAYASDADTDLVATIGTLDEYTPMVRTSGTQNIAGVKTFTNGAKFTYYGLIGSGPGCDYIDTADPSATSTPDSLHQTLLAFRSADAGLNVLFQIQHTANGTKQVIIQLHAEDGTTINYRVCGVDAEGNTIAPGYI